MTQPTSEPLSDEELAHWRTYVAGGTEQEQRAKRIITRLIRTLDQALARCEAAERRVEEIKAWGAEAKEHIDAACFVAQNHGMPYHGPVWPEWMNDAAQPEPDTGGV